MSKVYSEKYSYAVFFSLFSFLLMGISLIPSFIHLSALSFASVEYELLKQSIILISIATILTPLAIIKSFSIKILLLTYKIIVLGFICLGQGAESSIFEFILLSILVDAGFRFPIPFGFILG